MENQDVWHQLRPHPERLGFDLQDSVHALDQQPTHGTIFPTARTHGSGIKGWRWEWLLSLQLITHSQNFSFHSFNFGLCWFRGLGTQGKNVHQEAQK